MIDHLPWQKEPKGAKQTFKEAIGGMGFRGIIPFLKAPLDGNDRMDEGPCDWCDRECDLEQAHGP